MELTCGADLFLQKTGALELVAMEMKGAGMYVSRGLSFEGAEFEMVEP